MESAYKTLGSFTRLVDERNRSMTTTRILGINIDKYFMPSVANTIGTDLSNYKLLRKGLFACNPMHVGRDERLPIALYTDDIPAIVSPAYFVFEIADNSVLAEYLMMWFLRPDFDRLCWFKTDASVRGGIAWDDLRRIEIPVPPIDVQRKLVYDYKVISDRIALKRRINEKLEAIAQTLYDEMFVDNPDRSLWRKGTVGDVLQLQRGHDLPRSSMREGSYPVAGSNETIGFHNQYTAESPVIVMGRSGNIGNPRLYSCNCWVHNTALYVKQYYSSEVLWAFYLLKNLNYDEFVGGSAVPTLNRNNVHSHPILIPPINQQTSFSNKARHIVQYKELNTLEISKLEDLKKSLLSIISSH